MANFVDGHTLRSASRQTIQVSLGRTVTIGLYGPLDFAGKALTLVSDFAGNLRITPGSMRGNIRMFTIAGVKIGLTHLGAVTSTGDVWDTIDIVVHIPRKKRLPTWDKLFAAYPGDAELSPDFRARVGGDVDNDSYTNTCTLRLSEAFNGAGAPIPAHHPGLLAVKGADGRFYAFRTSTGTMPPATSLPGTALTLSMATTSERRIGLLTGDYNISRRRAVRLLSSVFGRWTSGRSVGRT